MGWFPVIISVIAAYLIYDTGHPVLFVIAIITVIGCFWSWGIMHNYATDLARKRSNYSGEFYDITEYEAQAVPNWIARVNMGFSALGLILLIIGVFIVWF